MTHHPRHPLRLWSTLLLLSFLIPTSASAIPAFARKYQLRCTACHEAWPVLNDFGRAFRDNGYQTQLGKDNPTTTPPGYWPVAIRVVPHYTYTSINNQPTDQGNATLHTADGFSLGAFDLLSAGTLGHDASFLFVPTFDDGQLSIESGWIRFSNLMNSGWLNVKFGHHEVDLPRSAHRPWDLSSSGFLVYGYHPAGSLSTYSLGDNQNGVEWVGHDRGSRNRVAVSLISVDGSPGSSGVWNTPGIYAHATHTFMLDNPALSEARIGGFLSDTTWPTAFKTADGVPIEGTGTALKHSRRYGLEGHLWFGPNVIPLHVIAVAAHGTDSKDLIADATADGTWNGGFLEIAWTPVLNTTTFFRYDAVRNSKQAIPDTPKNANDQTQLTFGVRHTIAYTTRSEYALHAEVSSLRTRGAAEGDPTVTQNTFFLGFDFAY